MKRKQSKKLLRAFLVICAVTMLIGSMATSAMADTSVEWTSNAGRESLTNRVSNTEFSVVGPRSAPTEFFSFDAATTMPDTSISTTDISFQIAIDAGAEDHGDFYGIFVIRMTDPSCGIWAPNNSGVSLQFNLDKIELRRWSRGTIDSENMQVLPLSIVDGEKHAVSIHVEEYKVTVTVDDQTLSAEYNFLPGSGGYQFMAYNSTIHISEFDDGTTSSAPVEPQPSEPPETQPVKPTEPAATEPQETKPAATVDPGKTETPDGNGSLYIIIAAGVVVLCVVVGAVYFIITKKKK